MPEALVKAVITSKWGAKGYRAISIARVEEFSVDSALDSDTDSWTVVIGDPGAELVDVLRRDNEVRVNLVAFPGKNSSALMIGFVDEAMMTTDGMLTLNGRDFTACAVDSQHEPAEYSKVVPSSRVSKEAKELGIAARLKLAKVTRINSIYTDGSETYWEFWYRMYRKKKMWIWGEPDGTLYADLLKYGDKPTYKFGTPQSGPGSAAASGWIQVERAEWRKVTTQRIGQIRVFGQRGDIGFVTPVIRDASIKDWVKKPRRIIQSEDAKNIKEAKQEAFEEIFESKVGAVEWRLTVANPGFLIRQNKMADVNIPSIGLKGLFFVVGVRVVGSNAQGLYQEVRLREKKFAISKRVPDDPDLEDELGGRQSAFLDIDLDDVPSLWGEYFALAAKQWHGPWPFDMFLACLLAICKVETGFRNLINGNTIEEYPGIPDPNRPLPPGFIEKWRNESPAKAVGPMQLYTLAYKLEADDRAGRPRNEFTGGRWEPEHNIWVAAHVLRNKLAGVPVSPENIYIGVKAYNGTGPQADAYAAEVKKLVEEIFLPGVNDAIDQAATDASEEYADLPASASESVRQIVRYAENQVGKPYVWGASGPNSFDCSGLVYAAYNSAGYGDDIGGRKTTFSWWNGGNPSPSTLSKVSKDNLLPADMVFFQGGDGSSNSPGHMGLYVGAGQMVAAPQAGSNVGYFEIGGRDDYVGALRLSSIHRPRQ